MPEIIIPAAEQWRRPALPDPTTKQSHPNIDQNAWQSGERLLWLRLLALGSLAPSRIDRSIIKQAKGSRNATVDQPIQAAFFDSSPTMPPRHQPQHAAPKGDRRCVSKEESKGAWVRWVGAGGIVLYPDRLCCCELMSSSPVRRQPNKEKESRRRRLQLDCNCRGEVEGASDLMD